MWTYEYEAAFQSMVDVIHVLNSSYRVFTIELSSFGQKRAEAVDDPAVFQRAFRVAEIIVSALNTNFRADSGFMTEAALQKIIDVAVWQKPKLD